MHCPYLGSGFKALRLPALRKTSAPPQCLFCLPAKVRRMASTAVREQKMARRVRGIEAIALNAVTTVLLAVLLGLAVFVNTGKPILFPLDNAAQRNPGWSTLDGVDPATW